MGLGALLLDVEEARAPIHGLLWERHYSVSVAPVTPDCILSFHRAS